MMYNISVQSLSLVHLEKKILYNFLQENKLILEQFTNILKQDNI